MNYTFFVTLALSGPRGQVQNGQKLRIFQTSSYFRTFEKKKWIHNDVDQEALYQKFKFYFPQGRGMSYSANVYNV